MNNLLSIVLKVKPSLQGLKTFSNALKGRLEEVKAFNQRISNGDAALRSWMTGAAAFLGAGAMRSYAAAAREAELAQQQLVLALRRTNREASLPALLSLAEELEENTNFAKEHIHALEAQLIAAGMTSQQVLATTEAILDGAAVTGKGTREATTDFLNTLAGGQEIIKRWGLEVGNTGDRVNDVLAAWQKGFGGAARAALVNPEEQRMLVTYTRTTESLGNVVRTVTLPFMQQMVKVLQDITEWGQRLETKLESVSDSLGKWVNRLKTVIIGLLAASVAFRVLMAVINPFRSLVVLLTGKTFVELIKKLYATAKASRVGAAAMGLLGKSIAALAWFSVAYAVGKWINELNVGGAKVKDWTALMAHYFVGMWAAIVGSVKGLWIDVKWGFKIGITAVKAILLDFKNWIAKHVQNTWIGKKLGINIDTTKLKSDIAAAKKELEDQLDEHAAEKAGAKAKANANVGSWIDAGQQILADGRARKDAAPDDTAAAAATDQANAKGRTFVDLQAEALKQARERYALETKAMALRAAGDTAGAQAIERQIKEQEALKTLGKGSEKLIQERLDLEEQEAAKIKSAADAADERSRIETDLTRLQTERQIAEQRGDRGEVARILAKEQELINDLIAKYQALAKAAPEGSLEQAEALEKVAALKSQAETTGGSSTRAQEIKKSVEDLEDATQHLQGMREGIFGGIAGWVASLGSKAEQVANTIKSTIGSVVSGITDGIMGWIDGTKTWRQSLASMGSTILKQLLQTIIQMGVQWLINTALIKTGMISIEATQDTLRTARVAKENAAEAAVLPAKTANAAATGIGTLGTALVFGGLAIAIIMAAMGGFDKGGFTMPGDKDQVAGVVHADEWVAPKWMKNHPVYGKHIAALEGIRKNGFSLGGYTTAAFSSFDPVQSLTRPAISNNNATSAGIGGDEVLGLLREIAGKETHTNVAVVDSDKAAARYANSRRGQRAIISGSDRRRRAERRV